MTVLTWSLIVMKISMWISLKTASLNAVLFTVYILTNFHVTGVKKVKNFTDSMQKYMSAMDRELTQTTISRSFVESKSPRSRMV